MAEQKTEVKTYSVDLICDDCGGKMLFTGMALSCYPERYEHRCEQCNSVSSPNQHYPRIVYEPVK